MLAFMYPVWCHWNNGLYIQYVFDTNELETDPKTYYKVVQMKGDMPFHKERS